MVTYPLVCPSFRFTLHYNALDNAPPQVTVVWIAGGMFRAALLPSVLHMKIFDRFLSRYVTSHSSLSLD